MEKFKIVSNPYVKKIEFKSYDSFQNTWKDIRLTSPNSELREKINEQDFLPFRIKEIMRIIVKEYYLGKEPVPIVFEGTKDEFIDVEEICNEPEFIDKVSLSGGDVFLENARRILGDTKKEFSVSEPIIRRIVKGDNDTIKNLNKIVDTLDDIIPICVFGNYSSGKSTFINALIGHEILPSGGDPVTAKIYRIKRNNQEDVAEISFEYRNEYFNLVFEGLNLRIIKGNKNCDLIEEIFNVVETVKSHGLFFCIRSILNILNGHEKKDVSEVVISNIIDVSVPFSKEGILGNTNNKFVIFDTPGSNSASNTNHADILTEALEGFSNGIPIWVTVYENIDSEDNASLCDKVLNINALDKRFTMIVSNKADGCELDEGGFSDSKINEILEFKAVNKMYSSGIYFVSSIMGLGAKTKGVFSDKHYRKVYRSQSDMYSDPEDFDYISLYKYNIMPDQIKQKALVYSDECGNKVYANSGLLCIEKEMDNFANRYSAYNKCKMVFDFLNDVTEKTDYIIGQKIEHREKSRKNFQDSLNEKEKRLIEQLDTTAERTKKDLELESKKWMNSYIKEHIKYSRPLSEFKEKESKIRKIKADAVSLDQKSEMLKSSKKVMNSNLRLNSRDIFKGEILDGFKKMYKNYQEDKKDVDGYKNDFKEVELLVNRETSDKMLRDVVKDYKNLIMNAKDSLDNESRRYWTEKARELRSELISIINGSDTVSIAKRKEITDIIMNYESLEFSDNADDIFVKKRFLRGNFLGMKLLRDERLDIKKLNSNYNQRMYQTVHNLSDIINDNSKDSFNQWSERLLEVIHSNITVYNQELKCLQDSIREETDIINEFKDNKKTIKQSFELIKSMMEWKTTD